MTATRQAEKLSAVLNRQVANWTVLYTKLHHFHWYVKGSEFFTLHAKFEELYTEAAERLDAIAERLLAIGGSPVSTLKESLSLATVDEAAGGESAAQMIGAIIADYAKLVEELGAGIESAQAAGDEATADLFIGQTADLQKTIWMLNAFLGK
ncbi:DNA starvation/stationary phase protection protein [Cohnella ginsengisoli]|uniref:DNA starvation/stationary phase protection protein n=1 Tax=Cohnella ginsengisoli TaxID=425004 RepID=A0A9X4QP99_9BACL|nr:Dps family protein [Cohnella ginsengisoli]MDG0793683.1 DNA starvation/stationary phase protection protein [Cohnella ginsengisoli]